MINGTHFVGNDEYADELMKLDFSPNMYLGKGQGEAVYKYCKENNMKFLKNTYASIGNVNFMDYFKFTDNEKAYEEVNMLSGQIPDLFDHVNRLEAKTIKDCFIYTTSPYKSLSFETMKQIEKIENLRVIIFNPYFLTYMGFIPFMKGKWGFVSDKKTYNPLSNITYGFTYANPQKISSLFSKIIEELNICPFFPFKEKTFS